jgi:nucleoid DNA-binding protein
MTSKANINRKTLASLMSEWSEDYLVYECDDMLNIFTEVIEQLVKEGRTIALDGFGTFQPKINPSFTTASLTSGEPCTYPESTTLKFTPAVSLQKRIKAYTKEKNDAVS